MSVREDILGRIRSNRPAGQRELPPLPHFIIPGGERENRLETFTHALSAMGGGLHSSSISRRALRGIRHRSFGHGRYRGRTQSRRPARALTHGDCRLVTY
jgi:hypothetical protein